MSENDPFRNATNRIFEVQKVIDPDEFMLSEKWSKIEKGREQDPIIKIKYKPCYVCGKDSCLGVSLCNVAEESHFKRLPLGECAHLECYIDYCVKAAIEEQVVRKDR